MQQAPSNSSQMRTAAIVTIVVIVGLLLLGRFVTGMMDNNANNPNTTNTTYDTNSNGDLVPPSSNTNSNTTLNTSDLGPVVVAQSVDRDNCAVDTTSTFSTSDPVYVVMEDAKLPEGTTMFARLYRDGVAVEDTRELTAETDYNNVCVSFVFEPTASAEVWDAGAYEAEFFVNGNSYRSTSFDIR